MHSPFPVAVLLCALSTLTAQSSICHSLSNNTVFDNNTSMGGPGILVGIRQHAAAQLVATRAEIWTGEQSGTNSIGIWSHDAVNDRPLANLGSASWSMSPVNGWQGATFASPVTIPANGDFWLVWAPIRNAQSSIQTTPFVGGPTYRASLDNGQNWNGPFTNTLWKLRIFCGGRPGHYEVFGTGCVGSNRQRPVLGFFNVPTIGQSTVFMLDKARGSSSAALVIGASNTIWGAAPLPFDMTGLGAPTCNLLASLDLLVSTPTDVTGQANLPITVPGVTALVGRLLYNQWLVLDPGANALQIVVSGGGRAVIGN